MWESPHQPALTFFVRFLSLQFLAKEDGLGMWASLLGQLAYTIFFLLLPWFLTLCSTGWPSLLLGYTCPDSWETVPQRQTKSYLGIPFERAWG